MVTYNELRKYILAFPETQESFPFGEGIAVFKVAGKVFAILGIEDGIPRVNLKCDPEEALALRTVFEGVIPGYHMNKKHWNTVILDGSVPRKEIHRMVENSYHLVVAGLKKVDRLRIQRHFPE